MGPSHLNLLYVAALALSVVVTFVVMLRLRRKQQQETVSENPSTARVRKRFSGQRVYALPLFGKHRWILRFIYGSTVTVPLAMAVVFGRAVAHNPGGAIGGYGSSWLILAGAAGWSALTIMFLRAMVRYRQQTTITLTAAGVRYFAPKVGLFPRREIFMDWDQISSVAPGTPQYPTVISVKSAMDSFVFDMQHTIEVLPYPKDGEFPPVENGDDLYRNLLEYSGLPLPVEMARTAPGLFRKKIGS